MTEYLISGRQSGKTIALLHRMEEDESIIMVSASRAISHEAHRIAEANGILLDRARFVTPTEVHTRKPGRGQHDDPKYVVDNVELVLSRILGGTIEAITGTGYAHTPPRIVSNVDALLKDI